MSKNKYTIVETESCNWGDRKRLSMRVVVDRSVHKSDALALLEKIGLATQKERNQDAIMVFGYRPGDNTGERSRWIKQIGDWAGDE